MVELQVREVWVVELRERRGWLRLLLPHPILAAVEVVMVKVDLVDMVVPVALVW
jgi:hypothetical protein